MNYPELCIADRRGKIYNVPGLRAVGMKAGYFFPLNVSRMIKLPAGSPLMMLPGRSPVGFDPQSQESVCLRQNPFVKRSEPCYAVAAFLVPGFNILFNSGYRAEENAPQLPLFAYCAVAFYKGDFFVPGLRVDREKRQDFCGVEPGAIKRDVLLFRKIFPRNRLVRHLESCALINQCPAAKNFFLKRYEAPLPTSPSCNCQCLGCISYQPEKDCPVTQPRIRFVPKPEEIAEVALWHIRHVADPVVSFGQGCEGEPLMVAAVLEKAIQIIRRETTKGVINLNTNASRPLLLRRLFAAGLDSMRVSINSFQPRMYVRYYRPKQYAFKDVLHSIRIAKGAGAFVSVNYLTLPGFTDSREEFAALRNFLGKYAVDMIQWRNLNYDPSVYFERMRYQPRPGTMLGIDRVISYVDKEHPRVMKGYFNPSRKRILRFMKGRKG